MADSSYNRWRKFNKDPLTFLTDVRGEGAVVRLFPTVYFLTDPDVIRLALQNQDAFSRSTNLFAEKLSDDAVAWKAEWRAFYQSAWNRTNALAYFSNVYSIADAAIHHINLLEEHKLLELIEKITTKSILLQFFGKPGIDLAQPALSLLHDLHIWTFNTFSISLKIPLPLHIRINRGRKRFLSALTNLIIKMNREEIESPFPVDLDKISIQQLNDVVIGTLLAGARVPAAAATWLLLILAKDKQLEEMVRYEINNLSLPIKDIEQFASLKTLQSMIKEVLRLYPPTWLISRESVHTTSLSDVTIPSKSTLYISPFVTHRDERFYDKPNEFDIERWQRGIEHPSAYFPFGYGSSSCMGANLAIVEIVAIVAAVFKHYRVKLTKATNLDLDPTASLIPKASNVIINRL